MNAQGPGLNPGHHAIAPSARRRVAEGVGFEPTVRLHAQRFSRPPRSTAPASLLKR